MNKIKIDGRLWSVTKKMRIDHGFLYIASRIVYRNRYNKIVYVASDTRSKASQAIKDGKFVIMNSDIQFHGLFDETRMASVLEQQLELEELAVKKSPGDLDAILKFERFYSAYLSISNTFNIRVRAKT